MAQRIFKFEERHDYLPENFLVSASNRAAYESAKNFTTNFYALNIYGQKYCGKTFLANIAITSQPDKKIYVIEDLDANANPNLLLQKLNSAKENNEFVLITSINPVAQLNFTLPDLKSRLLAIPAVGVEQPDEQLIYMMLARLFAARQIKISDDVINYLCGRVERNFEQLQILVSKIDTLALEQNRSITLPLIKAALQDAA